MDPVTGAALIGLGGDLLSGIFGSSATKKANKANIQLQRENQAWLKEMSGTAYQRSTQDMLAAGLNPMLGFTQGGASTPGSSAATVEPNMAMSRATSSAAMKAMQVAQLELTTQQARKAAAEADYTKAHTAANIPELENRAFLETRRMDTEINEMSARIAQMQSQGELTDEQARKARQEIIQLKEMLPYIKEASAIDTELKKYQVPSAKAESELWTVAGAEGKAMGLAGKALELFKKLSILTKDKK